MEVLGAVGRMLLIWLGGAGGVAVMAYLAKRLLDQVFSRELEQFKHELRAQHELELERTRADLRVEAHRQETRFSGFHERRVDVLTELYRRLVKAQTAHLILFHRGRPTEEELSQATRDGWEFQTYFAENLVFVPKPLLADVGAARDGLNEAKHLLLSIDEGSYMEHKVKAGRILNRQIPELLGRIQDVARRIVGDDEQQDVS